MTGGMTPVRRGKAAFTHLPQPQRGTGYGKGD